MSFYKYIVESELRLWQSAMQQKPSLLNRSAKAFQQRINRIIPEKVHKVITGAIKQMVRGVIVGAEFTTSKPSQINSLEETENKVKERIRFYRSAAAVEGAATGFGGILLGMVDFPLWLSLKMKMLFEIASKYSFDTKDYKERIYILHIFQLTFSSQKHRNRIYATMSEWDKQKEELPKDIHAFDWRTFQLEYRDYIDLAKLFQLIPGFGAVVGAYINHRFTNKLGMNAMNAYRMRLETKEKGILRDWN